MTAFIDAETGRHMALLSVRLITGILFFIQGYDKLFVLGINKVTEPFVYPFAGKNISRKTLHISILLSSLVEFAGGFMLIAGLFRDVALMLLLFNMTCVAAGFSMIRPMWDMQYYFPRLLLILLILLLPPGWDPWRLDTLFFNP